MTDDTTETQALTEVLMAACAILDAERVLYERMAEAVTAGCSWTQIGHRLGTSKQAAHERYRRLARLYEAGAI